MGAGFGCQRPTSLCGALLVGYVRADSPAFGSEAEMRGGIPKVGMPVGGMPMGGMPLK